MTSPTPVPSPRIRAFARVWSAPLTDDACAAAGRGWMFFKGSGWWGGEVVSADAY